MKTRHILFIFGLLLLSVSCSEEGYKERFVREFLTKPWGVEVPPVEDNVCVSCHVSEQIKAEYRQIPDEWRKSWHYENGVSCNDCHGGDPEDELMAMAPERGFIGVPSEGDIPEFCGKCHIGILENYLESGHGIALKEKGFGPTCVTCHGSHGIQKANIEIINETRCSMCHGYERARTMKAALLVTENRLNEAEKALHRLAKRGVYTEKYQKTLFRVQAEFRTLFHSVDVDLVKQRTDEFTESVGELDKTLAAAFKELDYRRTYSSLLMLVFLALGTAIALIYRTFR
jgi:nitrate/TMAO reductase-like tetraheme cytochrome c subunit